MMAGSQNTKNHAFGTLFTMLLFLVFVLCALFTVLTGGKVYENISSRMEQSYTNSVALQYVANKVRQGDRAGQVTVKEMEGTRVLELAEDIDGEAYLTWIYYLDGSIRELFTYADSGLTLKDGLEILECGGLSIAREGQLITIETEGEGGGSLTLSLRSAGGRDE